MPSLPRITYAIWAVFIALAGVFAPASAAPADFKQTREQFQQAEGLALKKQGDVTAIQKTVDEWTEQKATLQREVAYARSKVAYAREKLTQATTTGKEEDIKKFQEQLDNWEARVKATVIQLEDADSNIEEAIQNMQAAMRGKPENDLVLPGESIEVYVAEDETLNSVYSVRQGGYIVMPRVGRITVAGLDLAGTEKAIKQVLQVNQIKNATVMVERPQGGSGSGLGFFTEQVIFLSGEFLKPGAWKIPLGLSPTLVTTILRSGGLTSAADLTKVRLLRLVGGQSLAEEVNVQAILNGSGLQSDVSLQSGDVVMVPPYANVVYVTGNVVRPGALKLLPDDELTVYSAILRAGGFSRFANRAKVYVLRELGNSDKQKIPVDIKTLQEGGGGDLTLRSKDIVVVPERFFSF